MKISCDWLSDYIDISDIGADELREMMTTKVAEVDAVHCVGQPLAKGLVGRITRVTPHPRRAELRVARVQLGRDEVQVICGAPNCHENTVTAYIPPGGAIVVSQEGEEVVREVSSLDIGGVASQGMLVSERELGISADHSGIVELQSDTPIGASLSEVIGRPDLVIVIDNKAITHRPDLWCHFGFARELSAILGRPLNTSADRWADDRSRLPYSFKESERGVFEVEIERESQCRRFLGVEIRGIRNVPSPRWIRRRLATVGGGVRHLLVDLSNYVMWDIGQPNHTYDASKLSGERVTVRNARPGERFVGLDGVERVLASDDVVVADECHAACLGGILGGRDTAVSEDTTHLYLEAANWEPGRVRLTAKRHATRTDASNRFEKSQSPFLPRVGIERFAQLLHELQPEVSFARVRDVFLEPPEPLVVPLRYSTVSERLGVEVSPEQTATILTGLGFQLSPATADGNQCLVTVPYYRASRDVSIEEDLIEEVGRVFGYNELPDTAPLFVAAVPLADPLRDLENRIRDLLADLGFSEVFNYSFVDTRRATALGYRCRDLVELANPIDSERSAMRMSLVPGMLEMVERNARYVRSMLLFELGRSYHHTEPNRGERGWAPARERRLLSVAFTSGRDERELAGCMNSKVMQGSEFYSVVNVLRRVAALVGVTELEISPVSACAGVVETEQRWMHPSRRGVVSINSQACGIVAEVSPQVIDVGGSRVVLAEVDIEILLQSGKKCRFQPLPKFPWSFFEMSIVLPAGTYFAEAEQLLRSAVDSSRLQKIELLAQYEGPPLAEGERSISVRCALGAGDHTLDGSELQSLQQQLMAAVERRFKLRR